MGLPVTHGREKPSAQKLFQMGRVTDKQKHLKSWVNDVSYSVIRLINLIVQ